MKFEILKKWNFNFKERRDYRRIRDSHAKAQNDSVILSRRSTLDFNDLEEDQEPSDHEFQSQNPFLLGGMMQAHSVEEMVTTERKALGSIDSGQIQEVKHAKQRRSSDLKNRRNQRNKKKAIREMGFEARPEMASAPVQNDSEFSANGPTRPDMGVGENALFEESEEDRISEKSKGLVKGGQHEVDFESDDSGPGELWVRDEAPQVQIVGVEDGVRVVTKKGETRGQPFKFSQRECD